MNLSARVLASIALCLCAAGVAVAQDKATAAQRAVSDLESRLRSAYAKADAGYFERTLADDFAETGPSGETWTRADVIDDVRTGKLTFETLDRVDETVRVYGDVAVVNSRYLMKGTFRDHIFAGRYRFTRVWVRQRGAWRLASSQQTFFVEPREVEGAPGA